MCLFENSALFSDLNEQRSTVSGLLRHRALLQNKNHNNYVKTTNIIIIEASTS